MVRLLVGCRHPERDIFDEAPLDAAARPLPDATGVDEQPSISCGS